MHKEGSCSSVWEILPLMGGRTVACTRYIQASSVLKRLLYLFDIDLE